MEASTPTAALAGRVAVVTGGGSGIGQATCRALAEAGAAVFILDRDEAAARATATQLRNAGLTADCTLADVSKLDEVESAFGQCDRNLGPIDIVVAAAGVGCSGTLVTSQPTAWWPVLATNILGVMHAAHCAFRAMTQSRGDMVVIGSVSGLVSYSGEDIYVASKWALTGLTEAMRHEARDLGIRVTLIAPGLVDTPLARRNPFAQELLADQEAALSSQDVANAVLFAVSRPQHMALNQITIRPTTQSL